MICAPEYIDVRDEYPGASPSICDEVPAEDLSGLNGIYLPTDDFEALVKVAYFADRLHEVFSIVADFDARGKYILADDYFVDYIAELLDADDLDALDELVSSVAARLRGRTIVLSDHEKARILNLVGLTAHISAALPRRDDLLAVFSVENALRVSK